MLSLKSFLGRRPQHQDQIGPDHDLGEGKIEEEAAFEPLPRDEIKGVDLTNEPVSPPPMFRGSPIGPGHWNYGTPPHAMGVYRIILRRDGEHVYTGIAVDLYRRRWEHQNIKLEGKAYKYKCYPPVHSFGWKLPKPGVSYDDLRDWERRKMGQHGFPKNENNGGAVEHPNGATQSRQPSRLSGGRLGRELIKPGGGGRRSFRPQVPQAAILEPSVRGQPMLSAPDPLRLSPLRHQTHESDDRDVHRALHASGLNTAS